MTRQEFICLVLCSPMAVIFGKKKEPVIDKAKYKFGYQHDNGSRAYWKMKALRAEAFYEGEYSYRSDEGLHAYWGKRLSGRGLRGDEVILGVEEML